MYYTEKVENGITYSQLTPNGVWLPLNNHELTAQILSLKGEIGELVRALEAIANWKLPETGKFWDEETQKQPMSYGACYGSNGERDFFIQMAQQLLTKFNHTT